MHVHIALWAIVKSGVDLRGTTGKPHKSPLVMMLEKQGFESVDVQYGEGFLNYISGYTAKASDCLDFKFSEHVRKEENYKWKMTYRLLCKLTPCVPEVFVHFAGLPLMKRSFLIDAVYAPVQKPELDLKSNNSLKMYGQYVRTWLLGEVPTFVVETCFLEWCRKWKLDGEKMILRNQAKTTAIGVRFCFELLDIYICQYCVMFFPHCKLNSFLSAEELVLDYTKYFLGAVRFLEGLSWCLDETREKVYVASDESIFEACAFPVKLPNADLARERVGRKVFEACGGTSCLEACCDYLHDAIGQELLARVSTTRRETFSHRLWALAALHGYIDRNPADRARRVAEWNVIQTRRLVERRSLSKSQST